jgi:hypothetical protein
MRCYEATLPMVLRRARPAAQRLRANVEGVCAHSEGSSPEVGDHKRLYPVQIHAGHNKARRERMPFMPHAA